jgi:hypothetical protein
MPQLFANNARALLTSGINDTATSLTIEANKADLFPTANTGTGPVPSANNWYKVTLQDAQGNTEIVYVRTRTAGSGILSNVIRGQEGTTARSFSAGAVVGLRLTALDVQQSINVLSNNNVFSGANTFAGTVTFNQAATFNQTATFTQAATFNAGLTGNVTGNVTGNLTGNAATATNAPRFASANFVIEQSGTNLLFKHGSTTIASLTSAGVFTALSTVTGHGTP